MSFRETPQGKLCSKGLHVVTPANSLPRGDGYVQCRECRILSREVDNRRHHKPSPSTSGKCQKGLHPWVPSNWRGNGDSVTCAECARTRAQKRYHETARPCIVRGCRGRSVRAAATGYICLKHRKAPPTWIAKAGLRIVGTEVLAA